MNTNDFPNKNTFLYFLIKTWRKLNFYHIESLHPNMEKTFLPLSALEGIRDGIYKNHEKRVRITQLQRLIKNIKNIFFNLSKVDCLVIENPEKLI